MLFNSYDFVLLFLPIALVLFYAANLFVARWTPAVLFAVSIPFFAYWNPNYLPLLLLSICANYALGQFVAKRWVLAFGIVLNLAILFYYKYALFVVGIFAVKEGASVLLGNVILPLGISFFTFQQISYLVDIHRAKTIKPSFITYGAYVALFFQLIAGPIVRYEQIDRQLQRLLSGIPMRRLFILLSSGMVLFAIGLFKKVVIADSLANWADPVFFAALTREVSTQDAWLGASAYTFQLYFDFSAYSDMALGLARMFGLILPANFYSPYKSASISEFWRRWHMSLSYFVRDYIYIPLGGSRNGLPRHMLNLFCAFFLIGVWHGAGYTFALWGLFHATLVVLNSLLDRTRIVAPKIIGIATTFFLVLIGWVMFRAESLSAALNIYDSMFAFAKGRPIYHQYLEFELGAALVVLVALIAFFAPNALEILGSRTHMLRHGLKQPTKMYRNRAAIRRYVLPVIFGIAVYFGLASLMGLDSSFLYFNF